MSQTELPLIPKVGTSPNIQKLFKEFSELDDELSSMPKIISFLTVSLSYLHQPVQISIYPLYTYFSFSLVFTIIVALNKQFLNLKLLIGFLGQGSKS